MSDLPKFNYPAFDEAAAELRKNGDFVFSPADNDRYVLGVNAATEMATWSKEKQYEFRRIALAHDLEWICRYADAIALLPGWQNSTGAFSEWAAARALSLKFIYLP
jgi:hypothetical protein